MKKSIRIYTTTYCGYCARAKEFLQSKGLAFEEIDVTEDDAARAILVERSGGRRTVPQIFFGEQPIGGYADLVKLDSEGRLLGMLNSAA